MVVADVSDELDFDGILIQESDDSVTYMFSTEYLDRVLTVPKQFLGRFHRDRNWQDGMFMQYAKTVKNKTSDWVNGCGSSKSGVIPDNEPFAITPYENVPGGHLKIREDENYVYLILMMDGGFNPQECMLAVPGKLWEKYTTDSQWAREMFTKYGNQDFGNFPGKDAPDELFGFIPESGE